MTLNITLQTDSESTDIDDASSFHQSLILIVDDLINNLRLLRDTLQQHGYDVRSTTKGITALKVAKMLHPDLILLDIKMPDLDGYEICRQLKSDSETEDIPIIFLSAMSEIGNQSKAFDSGGIDFIAKPFQIQEVLMRVKNHLTIKSLQDNFQQQNQILQQEIEQRKQIQQELRTEKELAQITLNSLGDGVITTDANGYINNLNPAAEKLTGYSRQEAQEKAIDVIFTLFDEATDSPLKNPVFEALLFKQTVKMQEGSILISKDNKEYIIDYDVSLIRDQQTNIIGTVLVFRDITISRNLSRQLSWQATHDFLTQLLNRTAFEKKLSQILSNLKMTNETHVLCYLDLDKFKIVNDSCGHFAGDELLKQLTGILSHNVRQGDTLARLGGDEFALLLYSCPLKKAISIANLLKDKIQAFRFIWDQKSFAVSVSMGLVEINRYSQDMTQVLEAADFACFQAKAKGRNCVEVYLLIN
jgi:diguanylate cyclase (GGDEF)-like protein/PAS domain S-box-containing protein